MPGSVASSQRHHTMRSFEQVQWGRVGVCVCVCVCVGYVVMLRKFEQVQ